MLKMPFRTILILLLLSLLQACSLIKQSPPELNNTLNQLLNESRYDDIDALLNSINSNTDYQNVINRKAEIATKKQAYISSVSATAKKHKSKNQWQLAIETYNTALTNIEDNNRLKKELADLINERDAIADSIKKSLLVKQTNNLLSYKDSYEKLHQLLPDDYVTQYEISRYVDELTRATDQLNECAENAKQTKQYGLAKDCYIQAYKLNPSNTQNNKIKTLETAIKNDNNIQIHSNLLTSYQKAYKNKKYILAGKILDKILSLNPTHKEAIKLQAELKQEMNSFITSKIDLGKELYSEKKIGAALVIWKQASELAPNNPELIQLITRAEKVSKKIESLELSQ